MVGSQQIRILCVILDHRKKSDDEVYAIGDNGNAEIPKTGVAAHSFN